ncbi:hypothetical protein ACQPZA_10830 [Pseudonocardia xinjiangensis]|uniref:hypothetical protein n=1 Tax=Pseudonocardia xinjiangensis TaxID=75289 RepID=UPI003D8A8300
MTPRQRLAVLGACIVVALLVALYGATQFTPPAPQPSPGSVRLGPEPGDDVSAYLAGLPAELPPPGVETLALVQFGAELTVPDAVAAASGSVIDTAVLRVPLTRVQTALRFEPLDPGVAPETALDTVRRRAQMQADADAARLTGRPHDVAAAEAAALADPGCRCVLALVVRSDRAGLQTLAARPGVRAVEAAPPGTTDRELALAPLLPEQTVRADPPPDDGPVPPG